MRSTRGRVRRPRMRVRQIPEFSVNRLVPNVLTLLALCAGMTAIRFALNGNFQAAVYAIIVAGILDGLDGRIARLLKSTSRFGAELDSLSDFVSFGVAPAAVLYLWTMSALHSVGWAIVLFFAVCCALRLARFNTQLAAEPVPQAAGFFSGVPAPGGAGLVMMPMFASFEWGDWIIRSPYLSAVWIGGIALLMVSTIPTLSLKRWGYGGVLYHGAVADPYVRRLSLPWFDPADDAGRRAAAPRRDSRRRAEETRNRRGVGAARRVAGGTCRTRHANQ